ncbi:hypothetical protein MAR_002569 [Mya arenaria]|uniref:Uncharacterized protein n=1 Tax=Mya arenaria TaxID=6604 RepID=A0ABY7G7G3_MYAAR|nr:hypothetical protein MAR_002569 [Mya arenaria]
MISFLGVTSLTRGFL